MERSKTPSWTTRKRRPGAGHEGRLVVHGDRAVWLWASDKTASVYDPATDRWKALSAPFEDARDGAVVASVTSASGTELIAWGGEPRRYRSSSSDAVAGGVRLGADGRWRPLATAQQPSARSGAQWVWTGTELVIWGGSKSSPITNGAAYDPAADRWRKLSKQGASTTHNGDHLWSGRELWMWGGAKFSRNAGVTTLHAGFGYDPTEDRWRRLAGVPGPKSAALNARSLIRVGDAALLVRRDEVGGDLATCSVWRYEPRADLWEPCTPPPEADGDPELVDCGGRIVLVLGSAVFEYLAVRDAWARLPSLPNESYEPRLAWLAGALHVFERDGAVHRLELPAEPEPLAAEAVRPFAAVAPKRPDVGRGSPVTALAVAGELVCAGHLDGTVRCGDRTLRAADQQRVLGLAIHGGTLACLIGDGLELQPWPRGGRTSRVELPFTAHLLGHHGDRLIVAGNGKLAVLVWQRKRWVVERTAKVTGTTTELAVRGDVVARTVLGPPRRRGARQKTHDSVELRDATTLAVRATFASTGLERATTSAVPVANGVLVAGGGSYRVDRHAIDKRRPVAKLGTDTAWSSPIVGSADGRWLLARNAGRGAELYDLHTDESDDLSRASRELVYRPFDDAPDDDEPEADEHDDDDDRVRGVLPAYLPEPEARELAGSSRITGRVTVVAIDPVGQTIALGTSVGATFAIDRARLGITMTPATGRPVSWQEPRATIAGSFPQPLALAGEAERAAVCVIRSDGRFGELDVGTGDWSWGPTLPVGELGALREYDFELMAVRRRGAYITVLQTRSDVFDYRSGTRVAPENRRPDPDGRGLWTLTEERGYALVKIDAVTLAPCGRTALPAEPTKSDFVWLGGERWLVHLGKPGGAKKNALQRVFGGGDGELGACVVDAGTGEVVPIQGEIASETLDGQHFAVPEGSSGPYRRWRIYRDDLTKPVRTIESHVRLSDVGVLPGGAIVGWCGSRIAFFDDGGQPHVFHGHGRDILGVCPSRDGSHVATWDRDGTVRRWPVRGDAAVTSAPQRSASRRTGGAALRPPSRGPDRGAP